MNWITVIINLLLVLVTFLTVLYAKKTLHMEYSSQVIVRRYTWGYDIKREKPHYWEVLVKNVGKGYIVKAFILLSVKHKKKYNLFKLYYLSKPVVELNSGEERKILLELWDEELKKGYFNKAKLEVIYQDSLGNIFAVKPKIKDWNSHLETFDKLPKKMSKLGVRYWLYIIKMKIAKKQGNTSPEMLRREIKMKQYYIRSLIKPFNKEDTK